MENSLITWRPQLSSNLEFVQVDDKIVINHLILKYQVRVNKDMFNILFAMTGKVTLSEIIKQHNKSTQNEIYSIDEFYSLLKSDFINRGIIVETIN